MTPETPSRASKRRITRKGIAAVTVVLIMVTTAGAVGASFGVRIRGGNGSSSQLQCRGGMAMHGKILSNDTPVFPGDPETIIDHTFINYDTDFGGEPAGFRVESFMASTHTGTHLDVPTHFIEGARTLPELNAEEFVWPAYIIDVRDREDEPYDFELSIKDIKDYEQEVGRIKRGSMVIIQTGVEEEDLLDFVAPGFSGEAVQWMVDKRGIKGVGSDTLGPDATSDPDFLATFTILDNDGVALPGLTNLDAMNPKGDILIAPTVRLANGTGFQTNPISCIGR